MSSVNNGQKEFDLIIADSDTALFTAAQFVEESYVLVTSKSTGVSKEFKNVSTFRGTSTKQAGGWLKEMNEFIGLTLTRDDFEIQELTRLRPDITDHLAEAEKHFSYYVGSLKNLGLAKDYRLAIGGEGNFRYGAAKIQPYKGARKEKPLIFSELKDKVLSQYKSKILLANDCESDDTLGILGSQNQSLYRKTGKYKYLLAYLDKDIKQVWGPTLFLNKKELGVVFIEPFDAAKHFAFQCLKGDSTDNILGLPDLAPETRLEYNLRKTKGCGEVASESILEGSKDVKEMFTRVCKAYKEYYKEPVTISEGLVYCWKDFLRENSILLYMQRTKDQRFDIFTDLLDKIGVIYE